MSDIKQKIEELEEETQELEEQHEMKERYRELKKKRSQLKHPVFHSTIENIKKTGKAIVMPQNRPPSTGSPFNNLSEFSKQFSDQIGFSKKDKSMSFDLGKNSGSTLKELASIVKKPKKKKGKKDSWRWF